MEETDLEVLQHDLVSALGVNGITNVLRKFAPGGATAVQQGKALYVGISSYSAMKTREAHAILADMGVPLLIHQPSYSILNRWIERDGLLDTLDDLGVGSIVFSPRWSPDNSRIVYVHDGSQTSADSFD